LTAAAAAGYAGFDAYGFHAVETLQCMTERRHGGETGVDRVQSLSGTAMDHALADGGDIRELFEALYRLRHGDDFRIGSKPAQAREALWKIHYRDGLVATVGMFQGLGQVFGFAGRRRGVSKPDATIFELEEGRLVGHFGYLLRAVERMILTGTPSYPVERTLLTTGILSALLQSQSEGGSLIPTPHLAAIRYQPGVWPVAPDPVGTPA